MNVIVLGPQRRPTLDGVVRSLARAGSLPDGPIATVTAGWGEREADDAELSALLGGRDFNVRLHRRWLDVQDRDPGYAAAEQDLRGLLAELQDIYLLRLDFALRAVYALQHREAESAEAAAGAAAVAEAVAAVRELDAAHLRRVAAVQGEFLAELRPDERPVLAGHRAAVGGALGSAAALVIAGGHVGVLAAVLHLFNVAAAPLRHVIAWSAGAMALTDRIVLFGDRSPQGPGHAEVYRSGLGLLRGAVLLPHARARLRLEDTRRMAAFAARFAPARCILLDSGTRLDTGGDSAWPPGARVLAENGHVTSLEAA